MPCTAYADLTKSLLQLTPAFNPSTCVIPCFRSGPDGAPCAPQTAPSGRDHARDPVYGSPAAQAIGIDSIRHAGTTEMTNSQKLTKREETRSDICESLRSPGRTQHAQACTAPHRDRRHPSQTCGDPPALASRSTVSPSSRSCSRASRRAVSRKGAMSPRTPSPAHEGDGRHQKRRPEGKRDSAGHMGTMWCSPVHCEEASQVVGWQLRNLLSCSRQPSQPRHGLLLQARRGSSATRPFRRARSARAARRPRRHLDAFVLLRSATLCKFFGGASSRRIGEVLGLTLSLHSDHREQKC